ncbi:hypothetical protein Droror1_Dr00027379, partial [Drosera rotundifolia]
MRQFHSSTSHELVDETPALAESSPHDGDGVGLQVIGSACSVLLAESCDVRAVTA